MTTFALPFQINDSNKHIFAMFIEMAQHNFFVLMNHIYETALHEQLNADADGNQIEDFGKSSLWKKVFTDLRDKITTNEQAVKLKSLLYKHFPYLSTALYINKGSKYVSDLRTQLDNEGNPLIDTISDKSSLGKVPYCKDELIVLELISNFIRPLRNKFRHNVTDKQNTILDILSNYIAEIITKLIVGAEKVVTKKDKDGKIVTQKQIIKDPKMYFLRGALEIVADRFPDFDKEHKEAMKKSCTAATMNYLYCIMFIGLFLEKSYVKQFIDKCAIFNDIDKKYGFEMLGVYCTKLPAAKYDVTTNNVALALDILNELYKCPNELYSLISPQDQNRFRVLDEMYNEVFMCRKSDRFANLVMEYIDKNNLFERIRFQVSLGKYRYKFYNKTCIDGSNQVRTLQKDLNGFGRIDKMNEIRKNKWNNLIRITDNEENFAPKDTAETAPYITDHNPRYITNGNRIALWWNDDTKGDDFYIPTINGDKAPCTAPKAWMSVYELPAMMFLIKLKGEKFVEDLIIQKCVQKQHLYNKIATDSWQEGDFDDIDPKDLPRCLSKGAATDISSVMTAIKEKLRERIEKMEKYIEETEDSSQKIGNLAAWLSREIVFWMKKGTAPTGKNFSRMQTALANIIPEYIKWLHQLFDEKYHLKKINVQNNETLKKTESYSIIQCHPFLNKCQHLQSWDYIEGSNETVVGFCKEYIAKEKEYLEKVADKNIPIYAKIVKRHGEVNKQDKASKFASNPIELPTQMFEEEIRNATGCHDSNKNVAYIINNYLKNTEQDSPQSFYEMKRSYKAFDQDRKPVYKTVKEIEQAVRNLKSDNAGDKKFIKNSETLIKRFKVQDTIMFWMAKKTLMVNGMDIENFKLQNVFNSDNFGHILSDTGTVKFTVGFDDHTTLTIVQNGITLKKHSTLYRLIYDRRLKSLAKNLTTSTIDRKTLEYELQQYDSIALDITKRIMDFEDTYRAKYAAEESTLSKKKKTNDFNDMIADTKPPTLRISDISNAEKTMLIDIRNAFNHWAYPVGIADVENAGEGSDSDSNGIFRKYNKAKKVDDILKMLLSNISLV